MGKPAARITDMHVCPLLSGLVPHVGGPILMGAPTVLVGGLPAARVTDQALCVGPPDLIAVGSTGVMITGLPAARILDLTMHGGMVAVGFPTVLIGEVAAGAPSPAAGAGGAGGAAADMEATPPVGGSAASPAVGGSAGPGNTGPIEGLSRQANALLQAAQSHSPFCEECGAGAGG
jgi:uncharacterized Zn-binding protein involved in type VI secretion